MGTLANYSLDPAEDVTDDGGLVGALPDACKCRNSNTWDAVAHAVGHRWLSYVRFRDAEGNANDLLRGVDDGQFAAGTGPRGNRRCYSLELPHGPPGSPMAWPAFLDSDASVMGGFDLRDNGDGCFTHDRRNDRYSVCIDTSWV